MLDPDKKAFVVHIITITLEITIHSEYKAKIILIKAKKAYIFVPAKYLDFTNIFSEELTMVLPEYTEINANTINPEKDK